MLQALRKKIEEIPDGIPLKLWSAACSLGQEPLTLAMIISEISAHKNKLVRYHMLASDVCEKVLQRARGGVYTQLEIQRGLPAQLLIKYFTKDSQDRWSPINQLKSSTEYRKINLNEQISSYDKYDIILCRNVLIYQSIENKVKVIQSLSSCLNEGGILVLGAGESMMGISNLFEQQNLDGAIIYKKKSDKAIAA